ncbi:hypothetical protein LEN26_011027 [Aphanomyces euteiches]|nr:hypothetical protein LEN26_011027 [Aphanomyces euteiches]
MTNQDFVIALSIVVILLAFTLFGLIRMILSQKPMPGMRMDMAAYYNRPLLEEDFLGALYGLNRNDIEELMSEVKKWPCGVCAFANIPESHACALCETKQGVVVSETEEGPEFIHPKNFTPLQLGARTRKQWVRTVNESTGRIDWKQDAQHATSRDVFFVVTSTLPSIEEECLYGERQDDDRVEVVVDDPTLSQSATEHSKSKEEEVLELRMSREEEASTVSVGVSKQPLQIELAFTPLSKDSASRTLMATNLPEWLVQHLEHITKEPFSTKYLALLSLLKSNIAFGYSKFKVYREKIFEESIGVLQILGPLHLCTRTRIELIGELGVDAGGLQREWYTILTQAVFEPSAGLFVSTDSYDYTINPMSTSPTHLRMYRAIGRLLARSVLDEQMILGTPISMTDMLYMDKQIYQSLQFISTTPDVENLCLDFSVTLPSGEVVELVPNGNNIMVTRANQAEYVERMLQYLLFDRIQPQLQSLLTGLFEILPQHYLMMFDHKELELVLCGVTEIDMDDWKQFTASSSTLREGGDHEDKMEWFWDILTHMSFQDRAKFLQFATGSSRVPVQGFKGLTSYDGRLCPFSVKAIPYERGILPRAHACFNRIDLPLYPTKALMTEAMTAVVQMGMSEFTIV